MATTRPELLPACVALVAHPDDERYAGLFGPPPRRRCSACRCRSWRTGWPIPAKGTGMVMVCTFGDTTDVTWWRDLQLDTRPVIGRDGRLLPEPPPGITSEPGRAAYAELAGLRATAARRRTVELLGRRRRAARRARSRSGTP